MLGGERFRRNVAGAFHDGTAWLESLPTLIHEFEIRWGIEVGPPFESSYNYVAPALTHSGEAVVFKIGVDRAELAREADALAVYSGRGAVKLLRYDPEQSALLLERVEPGLSLADRVPYDDEFSTRTLAKQMRGLWRAVHTSADFVHVSQIFATARREHCVPLGTRLNESLAAIVKESTASCAGDVLLHGDLHHGNLLESARLGWAAIDPKGVVGPPGYDVGAMFVNPDPSFFLSAATQRRRVCILSESLGISSRDVLRWGIIRAGLAALWDYEDQGTSWPNFRTCMDLLLRLLHE